MKRTGIIVLFVMLSASSIAQQPAPRLALAAAATGPWWQALLGMVGQFLTALSGGKVNTKAAQSAVTSNAGNLDQGLTYLQAWPTLLDQSQLLREDAIQLGQMVSQLAASPDDVSDDQWSDFNQQVKSVQAEFKSIYGNQTNIQILQNAGEYFLTMQNANQSWNVIDKMIARPNKTSAQRKSSLQSVNGSTAAITAAAMLPEWWAIEEARALAAQYQNVTNQAKSAQGGKAGPQPSGGNTAPVTSGAQYFPQRVTEPRLVPIASSPRTRIRPVSAEKAATDGRVDNDQQPLSAKAADLNRVPFWMSNSLTQTRKQYQTNWYQTLGGGLVGAILGFICMLLLPAFTRTRLKPRNALEIELLNKALSFHSDERAILADQIGALHLDVLNYVWNGPTQAHFASAEAQTSGLLGGDEVSTPSDGRIARIQRVRSMLRG